MTTFGWKRKVGDKVSRSKSAAFENEARGEGLSEEVDWLTGVPRKKILVLEDAKAKSARLRAEGAVLAEENRCWEACKKFDEALELTPNDETLYEMKAQAFMCLNEVYPAVYAAEKAVLIMPNWWVGHQTLGRAQLGLGEVRKAVKSFCKAVHLYPADEELRSEDLIWAVDLLKKKQAMQNALVSKLEKENKKAQITELNSEGEPSLDIMPVQPGSIQTLSLLTDSKKSEKQDKDVKLDNYVKMRDF